MGWVGKPTRTPAAAGQGGSAPHGRTPRSRGAPPRPAPAEVTSQAGGGSGFAGGPRGIGRRTDVHMANAPRALPCAGRGRWSPCGRPGRRIARACALCSARASPPLRPGRRCPRAETRSSDVGPSGPPAAIRPPISDHLLERLHRTRGRRCLAGRALNVIGSPVNGFLPARPWWRACDHLELQEAGDDELAGALLAQLPGDQCGADAASFRPRPVLSASAVSTAVLLAGGADGGRRVGGLGCGLRGRRGKVLPRGRLGGRGGGKGPSGPVRGSPCSGRPWVRLSWPWSLGRSGPGWKASIGSCGPGRAGSQGRGSDEDRSGNDLILYRKRRMDDANPPLSLRFHGRGCL